MKALLGAKASRFVAALLLLGVFTVAGHHYAIVASSGGIASVAIHQDAQPHPGQEHEAPNSAVEAHAPTPIIQKFQLQKQLEIVASLSHFVLNADSPYREITVAIPSNNRLPARLPLDLKTVFLN